MVDPCLGRGFVAILMKSFRTTTDECIVRGVLNVGTSPVIIRIYKNSNKFGQGLIYCYDTCIHMHHVYL